MRRSITYAFIVMALLCAMTGIVSAAPVTKNITYQGMLTNAAGTPLTGTYTVMFKLYEVSSGGSVLATDTHSVQASKGVFTTQITAASSFFDGRALWLGITVGADAEMTPRQELRPVPYALSLRPGATIAGSGTIPVLNLTKFDEGGLGLNVITTGFGSKGVYVVTKGQQSAAIHAIANGPQSNAIVGETSADGPAATAGVTTGNGSYGLYALTSGTGSHGLYAETSGSSSAGVYAKATGPNSPAITALTFGSGSPGAYIYTTEINSPAIRAHTLGDGSPGTYSSTSGTNSHGVEVYTLGLYSNGINVSTSGLNSIGVRAISSQYHGLQAYTGRNDHKYGIYTPDYLYAMGTQVPAADVAEYMPVSVDVTPGTVLVIGEDGKLQTTATAYDTRVAGIVSTDPGVSLGTKEGGNPGEEIIAVAGRVPCKVDATSAPIHAGDLLTTSDNPGYAMKAEQVSTGTLKFYLPGTTLGKAMGTLESGTGTIEVLVTLQ